jgi:hypothetical protein
LPLHLPRARDLQLSQEAKKTRQPCARKAEGRADSVRARPRGGRWALGRRRRGARPACRTAGL